MIVSWTEPYASSVTGNDHLGMRTAGEVAFARLFDFTTSVTFRPRYYSFLCWALRGAFVEAGGVATPRRESIHRIDSRRWVTAMKRRDYLFGLATLLADPDAERIAGRNRLMERIVQARKEAASTFEIRDDHLQSSARTGPAAAGSLGVYAGAMRALRLLESAEDVSLDRPSRMGNALADAFAESLRATDYAEAIEAAARTPGSSLSSEALTSMGAACGASKLTEPTEWTTRERNLLRSVIIDLEVGSSGSRQVRQRLQSIGLALELRRVGVGVETGEDVFRAACLDQRHPGNGRPIELPKGYRAVLGYWRLYHAHAYATLALENLLANVLEILDEGAPSFGPSMTRSSIQTAFRDHLADAADVDLPAHYEGWGQWPIGRLLDAMIADCDRAAAELNEYALARRLRASSDLGGAISSAALLFFGSIARMVQLQRLGDEWIGDTTPWRLPPQVLVDHAGRASAAMESASDLFIRSVDELVIEQHVQNALRKLALTPRKPTARLVCEGDRVSPVAGGNFIPGTSHPRFDNTVLFLQDLGYVEPSRQGGLTDDGATLLKCLREVA